MKQIASIITFLALATSIGFTIEPPPPPTNETPANTRLTRDEKDLGENIFVGHFGETVRLAYFWTADAVMQGPVERVNFHTKKIDPNELMSPRFNPASKDYIPENFEKLRLMQMLVIPKNSPGGFRSMKALRAAKEGELNARGYRNAISDQIEGWPPDSFLVTISTPYRLFQIYTQSDKNYFIITSGADPYDKYPADSFLVSETESLIRSLSTYLDGFHWHRPPPPDAKSGLPGALYPGAAVCVVALLLGLLKKQREWLRKVQFIGRSAFGFTTLFHILAVPILYIAWQRGSGRTVNESTITVGVGLMTPLMSVAATRWLGGQRMWRVFLWSAVASSFPILLGYSAIADFWTGNWTVVGARDFRILSRVLSLLGVLNGLAFALAHKKGGEKRI